MVYFFITMVTRAKDNSNCGGTVDLSFTQ